MLAADDAEEVGDWTIVQRRDGTRQWALDEQPLYTSVRDKMPGDVLGGDTVETLLLIVCQPALPHCTRLDLPFD